MEKAPDILKFLQNDKFLKLVFRKTKWKKNSRYLGIFKKYIYFLKKDSWKVFFKNSR